MNYIKAKYPNQSRSYIFATSDDVKAGDMVVNAKGAKLTVTDETVDMKWVATYGADKMAVVKKYEEPEKRYIVEREFEHAGYKCVVIFGNVGHRCGYVGIPKNHPLYGKDYGDHLEIKKTDIGERKVSGIFPLLGACLDEDERIRIEAYFSCHGGITYAGGGDHSDYPIESDLWWFGFDCAHYGDADDLDRAIDLFPSKKDMYLLKKRVTSRYPIDEAVIRTEEYVTDECKKLAEQLKEFEESEE